MRGWHSRHIFEVRCARAHVHAQMPNKRGSLQRPAIAPPFIPRLRSMRCVTVTVWIILGVAGGRCHRSPPRVPASLSPRRTSRRSGRGKGCCRRPDVGGVTFSLTCFPSSCWCGCAGASLQVGAVQHSRRPLHPQRTSAEEVRVDSGQWMAGRHIPRSDLHCPCPHGGCSRATTRMPPIGWGANGRIQHRPCGCVTFHAAVSLLAYITHVNPVSSLVPAGDCSLPQEPVHLTAVKSVGPGLYDEHLDIRYDDRPPESIGVALLVGLVLTPRSVRRPAFVTVGATIDTTFVTTWTYESE